jgi:hypothetical protein
MELSSSYDFVILGENPAALWAARHLLALEQKVLILPMGHDSGMNIMPLKALDVFGLRAEEGANRSAHPMQVLFQGHRFRLGRSMDELKEEFNFHFGKDSAGKLEIPNELLRGMNYFIHGSETGPALPESWSQLSARYLETIYFEEEKGWLNRRLLKKLSEAGAHVARQSQLKQIFLDRKTFVGVQLAGTSRMIAAKNAILGAHFDYLKGFMNEPVSESSRPIGWNFDLRFECSPEALPLGMSTRMIHVEKDAPVLEIVQERVGRFRLSTHLPLQDRTLERGEQRRLAERMLKVCESLIPDLEYNLKSVSPDIRDPERVETVALPALYPFQDLHQIPMERLSYGVGSALGFQCSVNGLYLVGHEANPRDGVWGSFQAANQAIEHIAKKDQKPELLRSKSL